MQTTGEEGYLALLGDILANGRDVLDRTGVGTRAVFGRQIRFDLQSYFPLLTTKKVFFKGIVHELLWFLAGDSNIAYLNANGVHIWNEWADENGNLGPVYGKQWRSWPLPVWDSSDTNGSYYVSHMDSIDQISKLMDGLKNNPHGRRHIVTAWNPAEIDEMALPPCHCLFQFFVRKMTDAERIAWDAANGNFLGDGASLAELDGVVPAYYLDCQLYQRSADTFLGVPFNIASYALLTHMIAHQLGYAAGEFVHTFGDVHIYTNHVDQVLEQMQREILVHPTIKFKRKPETLFDYRFDDIEIVDYHPHPAIKAPIAV